MVGYTVVAGLRLIDFLTHQERQVMVVLDAKRIVGCIGPYVVQTFGVGECCQWLVLMYGLRTLARIASVEAALVCPLQTDGTF